MLSQAKIWTRNLLKRHYLNFSGREGVLGCVRGGGQVPVAGSICGTGRCESLSRSGPGPRAQGRAQAWLLSRWAPRHSRGVSRTK